jgi:DNA-binding CsgD family transcriptional regulator
MAAAEPCTEDEPPPGWRHTPAQWRVARRLALGLSVKQIAEDIQCSRHTVDMHLKHLALRLDGQGTRRGRIVALVQTLHRAA